ncbi:MAG: OmpA family protein [Desulfovibrionaceae bacterium]
MRLNSLFLFALLLFLPACAETVILLPNDQGHTGAVVVTPKQGSPAVLDQPYSAVDATDTAVGKPYQLTEQQVRDRYAETLNAQPEAPAKFMLYFYFDDTKLKPESEGLMADIMAAYRDRKSTDVSVVGHSDRSGDRQYNYTLSKRRAEAVAKQLKALGMDPAVMEITSHGEENPLVPTADDVAEPRNRRVEVTVR